jgi:hypothetical protein
MARRKLKVQRRYLLSHVEEEELRTNVEQLPLIVQGAFHFFLMGDK